jgi:hypothetical protein
LLEGGNIKSVTLCNSVLEIDEPDATLLELLAQPDPSAAIDLLLDFTAVYQQYA